jgi:3-hydroxy-9,10-secoandrosta-1,3,5(10)-triene-9,17-dione monooxygenase
MATREVSPEPATGAIPVPDPSLTAEGIVARARAMRATLRERQAECEAAGRISDATNRELVAAGFYRTIQPRQFGGYEFDVPTFARVMMEISRGCPETGWVLALTSGHVMMLAALDERAQVEAYGANGDFRAPSAMATAGTVALPVAGGFRVSGAFDYVSGCDLATHIFGSAPVKSADGAPAQGLMHLLFDRKDYTVVDNWQVFGMRGTGSRRATVDNVFVPDYRAVPWASPSGRLLPQRPGLASYRNPMYRGHLMSFLVMESLSVSVGAAYGALDVYEETILRKSSRRPPFERLYSRADYQRVFGRARALIATAEAAMLQVAANYMELTQREAAQGVPFDDESGGLLLIVEQQCINMAWEATEMMFRTAGTSAARSDSTLGRYFRNLAVIRTHIAHQYDSAAINFARLHFGPTPLALF